MSRYRIAFLLLLATQSGVLGWASEPSASKGAPQEASAIVTRDYPRLHDRARRRSVPLKVHAPLAGGPYPLVVVSHGGAGDRDSHLYQAQHLASHGYVVVCMEHVGSNTKAWKRGMWRQRQGSKAVLHGMVTDSHIVLARPRDITFAIDQAKAWNRADSDWKGRINTQYIAVVGHSYGAYTILAACGARPRLDRLIPQVGTGKGLGPDLGDKRITFGFAMSPQPPGEARFSRQSFATIQCPLVLVSGSKDESNYRDHPGTQEMLPPEARLETYHLIPTEKHLFWLSRADHLCFVDSPGTRRLGRLLPCPPREDAQRITKVLLRVFCDYYLKEKKDALAALQGQGLERLAGSVIDRITWKHEKARRDKK